MKQTLRRVHRSSNLLAVLVAALLLADLALGANFLWGTYPDFCV